MLHQYLLDQALDAQLVESPLELAELPEVVVVDCQAVDDQLISSLQQRGAAVVLHQHVVGGVQLRDSWRALESLLGTATLPCVVWQDTAQGPVELKQWEGYEGHRGQIAAVVPLPHRSRLFRQDVSEMLARGQSFEQAFADSSIMLMSRQRLTMVRRALWQRLDAAAVVQPA